MTPEIELPGAMPAWLLRIVLAAAAAVALLLAAWNPVQGGLALLLGALLAWRPVAVLVAAVLGLVVGAMVLGADGSIDWRTHALVLLAPALLVLGRSADQLPWRGRVDRRLLLEDGRRVAVVQVGAQPLTVLAGALDGSPPAPWLAVAAVVALGVLGWLLTWRPAVRPPYGPR